LTLAVRVPGGAPCVVTRCRVIGVDAMAAGVLSKRDHVLARKV
jgi:hypothetical protein